MVNEIWSVQRCLIAECVTWVPEVKYKLWGTEVRDGYQQLTFRLCKQFGITTILNFETSPISSEPALCCGFFYEPSGHPFRGFSAETKPVVVGLVI